MKRIVVTVAVIALTAGVAMADKPNNNGSGGQVVKSVNKGLKEAGTNLGQFKKTLGLMELVELVELSAQSTSTQTMMTIDLF